MITILGVKIGGTSILGKTQLFNNMCVLELDSS